jgi:ATP-dependent helicase/nuclease subunit A
MISGRSRKPSAIRGGSRLQALAANQPQTLSPALSRAARLLAAWLARADALPVHDQLDRIYFESDLIERYCAAVPPAMREAVTANLHALMQRALDTDAGRYPSLPRFIHELAELGDAPQQEAPDEGLIGDPGNAVRILTVHGAKGLESPIVCMIDTAAETRPKPHTT